MENKKWVKEPEAPFDKKVKWRCQELQNRHTCSLIVKVIPTPPPQWKKGELGNYSSLDYLTYLELLW